MKRNWTMTIDDILGVLFIAAIGIGLPVLAGLLG
jgi:hypothetical protein